MKNKFFQETTINGKFAYYLALILIPTITLTSNIESKESDKTEVPFATAEVKQEQDSPKPKTNLRRVDERKGTWTFQWGYNRTAFSQSDINFRGPGYHFTLKSVDARDKPQSLDSAYVNPTLWETPQFNFKFAYYITDHFFISFGEDHMKYVMTTGQAGTISGYIDPLAIERARFATSPESSVYLYAFPNNLNQFAGYHGGGQTVNITPDFLKFEHTDGLNFFFIEPGFTNSFWVSKDGEHAFSLVGSAGGGPVICRSDVRLFGEGKNNHFHLSGYGVTAYVGTRLDLFRSFFIEFGGRGGYIDLTNILTTGRSKDRATQNFDFMEMIASAGTTF
ncbi:hypothetical protein LEP1GSC058_4090 [Leptospira fainei serovar Hurstbridge str. BUT 6]|uniref:Outer membrane protein n=1 Tax=Leptospira fainei serovar Hurstbridge str. BUT 6 TaxID=1193011 RepID=S3UZ40_9LEPT|nr:hypothetical protein [Leptospira fainei]EPG73609.1 hypothetical protein LEP1GSC058_4090 [Leptospira fainei serovar Hurstbridge str. BUT 6]